MTVARYDARQRAAVAAALLILGAAAPILLVAPRGEFVEWLTLVLAACSVASGLTASRWQGTIDVSATFVCSMLAVAFAGPLGVFVIAILTEVATWAYARDRLVILPVNLAANATPALLAAVAFRSLAGSEDGRAHDIAMLGLVSSASSR